MGEPTVNIDYWLESSEEKQDKFPADAPNGSHALVKYGDGTELLYFKTEGAWVPYPQQESPPDPRELLKRIESLEEQMKLMRSGRLAFGR